MESADGKSFEARCVFKRPFAAGAMREINYNEDLHWMGGFNIYRKPDHEFRYIYGFSYESDKRNREVVIKANALLGQSLWVSLTFAAACVSLMF